MEFALGDVPADAPVSAEELLRMYALREAELRRELYGDEYEEEDEDEEDD